MLAIAEYLRDVFHLQISVCIYIPFNLLLFYFQLDCWDSSLIERNLIDYIATSVFDANKILVINSLGAHERYMAKILPKGYLVEREDPGTYLFLNLSFDVIKF